MTLNLKENHAEILAQWANGKNFRLGRRAWLVEEYSKGMGTKELSRAVAMPEQRIVEIIDRYKEFGLLGLIESPRSGRTRKISSEIVKDLVSEMLNEANPEISANQMARTLRYDIGKDISKDAIWRQARMSGIQLERNSKNRIQLSEISRLQSSIIGVVVTPNIKILAKLSDQRINFNTPSYIEVTCENLANIEIKKIDNLFDAIKLIKNQSNTRVSKRSSDEAIVRWANNVCCNAKRKNGILKLVIQGDYSSNEMHQWLKVLRRFGLQDGSGGLSGTVIFNLSDEEWVREMACPDSTIPKNKRFADFIWARIGDISAVHQ